MPGRYGDITNVDGMITEPSQLIGGKNESKGSSSDRSLSGAEAPHVALQGKGSWIKLLTLLEVSPDALVMADVAGRIVSVNS